MRTILAFRTGPTGTWREKLMGITTFAKAEGWHIQTIDGRSRLPDVRNLIAFWDPAGIILDASGDTTWLPQKVFTHTPCVSITPSSDAFRRKTSSVRSSSREIASIAARELLRREIKTLAFIEAPGKPSWSTEKREAFRDVAALHGFSLRVIKNAHELFNLPKPIGLFSVTDFLAAEALVVAGKHGLRVPEDLSVVGVDDDPEICENCEPTLTSVRPDFRQLGFAAAQVLCRQIDSPCRRIESVEIPPVGLIRRASSGAHADTCVSRALEKIRLHACEGISVPDIAAVFGACSRRSAELRFKAATGMTMTDALLDVRLSRARDYLKEGKTSVSAVANFCGWTSDITFRKAFKNKFGILPTDLRKSTLRTQHKALGTISSPRQLTTEFAKYHA